jgi:hypothetical protein
MILVSTLKSLLLVFSFSLSSLPAQQRTVVEGKVLWENSNTPVANVYLYITAGEEEALTDNNGNFKIETWKKLPVDLVVKYKDQPPFHVTIKDGGKRHTVWLKKQ